MTVTEVSHAMTTPPQLRKFCLLCDTIDDQRRSTRRLHDVDSGMSVLVKVKLRTTEKQACMRIELCSDKHITLTTHVYGLFHTSSCRKNLDFLKVKVPGAVSHNEGICPLLRSLPQSVEREYQRFAPAYTKYSS